MSKARIWKQDPSVKEVGIRITFLNDAIEDGPKDDMIEIKGLVDHVSVRGGGSNDSNFEVVQGREIVVKGDKNRDFLFDPNKDSVAFDAVHTFVVARQVVTMYQRALKRANVGSKKQTFTWQWGPDAPIQVHPRAGVMKNAYYSRNERALKFFFFQHKGSMIYITRSFDVVAHEVGHAILDGLLPGYFASWHPQTGGLHESFGDITAILAMLSQLDQCEAIIAHSKADLHVKSFFNSVAEQFGAALGRGSGGLRNADNNLTMSQVSNQVHDISQVFTGAFYDILADIFADRRNPKLYEDAQILYEVGQHMCDILIAALLKGPKKNATFADIAKTMMQVETNKKWKNMIKYQFQAREVLGKLAPKPIKKPVEDIQWSTCCSTMCNKEHLDLVDKAIRKKKSFWGSFSSS